MLIGVLGWVEVRRGDRLIDLGRPKQRAVLAALAMTPNRVVPVDVLIDLVWPADPPAAAVASLHGYVAGLRRVLEPDRARGGRPSVLVRAGSGYELRVPSTDVDAVRFVDVVEAVHRDLGGGGLLGLPDDRPPADLHRAAAALTEALGRWRGTPYADLGDAPAVTADRARLESLRLLAQQDLARVGLALGEEAAAAADLEALVGLHPLHEDLWVLRAIALTRIGRQADALDAIRTARAVLDEELGIEVGPALRDLEVAILRQDSALRRPAAVGGTPPDQAPREAARTPIARGRADVGPLPLVGREQEVSALEDLLARAIAGTPGVGVLIGESGIGKTRLTEELASRARAAGVTVLIGRCSPEEGSPPLWPWVQVLRQLADADPDVDLASLGGPDGLLATSARSAADRFRMIDAVVQTLLRASAAQPLLVVVDDLHWVDASSARMMRHLVEDLQTGRILVLAARRARPEPTGAAAELAESLARRADVRLELTGLTAEDVNALATSVVDVTAEGLDAGALRARTGGNPFFLVELLRLWARQAGQPEADAIPTAVGDVIRARLGQLPDAAQELLRLTAVLGDRAPLDLLAVLADVDEDEVLDRVEPAMAAGLVVEGDDGALHLSHALLRDAVYAAVPPLRRQRLHARIAELLEARRTAPAHLAETAHHWRRAGPAHAARAWQVAAAAAAHATALRVPEDAAALLAAAVASQEQDSSATAEERFDLLLARAQACRAVGDGDAQRATAAAAVRTAEEIGDVERMAVAAITGSEGALWGNRPLGEVDPVTVGVLRRVVAALPPGDSPLRCRAALALSRELYWSPQPLEREAHAEEGLAMARRLGDPRLMAAACHVALVAAYRPATLEVRTRLAAEAVGLSRQADDPEGEATGLFWQTVIAAEAGRLADRRASLDEVTALIRHHQLRYLQVMLASHEAPWLAAEGRFDEAEALLDDTVRSTVAAAFPFMQESLLSARLCVALWRGRAAELLPPLLAMDETSPVDLGPIILLLLLRTGILDEAAARFDAQPIPLVDDTFEAPMLLAIAAEAAELLDRPAVAAEVYTRMARWAGRAVTAGTGMPLGPVDAFLALSAAATGELAQATRHADRAVALCETWGVTPVAAWLRSHRARGGF